MCEGIGEDRDTQATARQSEDSQTGSALERMKGKGYQTYTHARVELTRVPGGEKLRVRVLKERTESSSREAVADVAAEVEAAIAARTGEDEEPDEELTH